MNGKFLNPFIGLLKVKVLKVPLDSAFVIETPLRLFVEITVGVISESPPFEINTSTLETEDPVNLDCKIISGFPITMGVGGNKYPLPPLKIPTLIKVKLFFISSNVGISALGTIVLSAE